MDRGWGKLRQQEEGDEGPLLVIRSLGSLS